MKIIMLTLVLVLCMSTCFAMPAADKVAHFGVGYIINDQLSRHTHLTFIERTLVVLGIAYAKERTDAYIDKNDIAATLAGGLFYEVKF